MRYDKSMPLTPQRSFMSSSCCWTPCQQHCLKMRRLRPYSSRPLRAYPRQRRLIHGPIEAQRTNARYIPKSHYDTDYDIENILSEEWWDDALWNFEADTGPVRERAAGARGAMK
jgi:hypothetical protein